MLPRELRCEFAAVKDRLASGIDTVRADGTVGPEPVNPDGPATIRLLDDMFRYIGRLQDRLEHEAGCMANDMDPLDHAPCTCGLRDLCDPWGRQADDGAIDAGITITTESTT